MGRKGKRLTPEEETIIRRMMEEKIKPRGIAAKIHRSANCVYEFLRDNHITIPRAPYPKKIEDAKRIEFTELSSLPDTILFRHQALAIP